MKSIVFNKHRLIVHDSIEDLPIRQFHKYNKYLMIDSGIGSDMNDFNNKINSIIYYVKKSPEKAIVELENLRQHVYFRIGEIDPKFLSFLCLVKSIDGEDWTDFSEIGLDMLKDRLSPIKKKTSKKRLSLFGRLFR